MVFIHGNVIFQKCLLLWESSDLYALSYGSNSFTINDAVEKYVDVSK